MCSSDLDDLTIYTVMNLPVLTMDHIRGPGNPTGGGPGSAFTTHTSGIGDTQFGALGNLIDSEHDDLIINVGFSVPTGDIFDTSANSTAGLLELPLEYPMRKGSGTFNARPGITYRHFEECSSFGVQYQGDHPIGENYRDAKVQDHKVIRPYDDPMMDQAGFVVVGGNLFDAALMKTSVISDEFRAKYLSEPGNENSFEGRAIVFDGPEDYHDRINDPTLEIDENCLLFIRGCGPLGYPGSEIGRAHV